MIKDVHHHLLPRKAQLYQMKTFLALFYGLRQKEWMNREFFYKEIKTETLNLGYRNFCKVMLCWNFKIQGKSKPLVTMDIFFKTTLASCPNTAGKFNLLLFSLKGEIIAL